MKTQISKEELKGFVNAVLHSHPEIDWESVRPTFTTELLGGYQVRVNFEWNKSFDMHLEEYVIDTYYIFLEMKENRFAKEFENLLEIVDKISQVEFKIFSSEEDEVFKNFDND